MKRVLIVEDHPIMSAGTCQMVKNHLLDVECFEVETFWKAIEVAGTQPFDLVIMDIAIPGGDSVQMVERFKKLYPSSKLLMFSGYEEKIYALPYIKAGAIGFLSKKASEQEFRSALDTVLFRGRVYLSDQVRDLTLNNYIRPNSAVSSDLDTLSIREREVLELFYARKGVSEIARVLNLSTSTVNTHRVRIFAKMGVENMLDLVRRYEQLYRDR